MAVRIRMVLHTAGSMQGVHELTLLPVCSHGKLTQKDTFDVRLSYGKAVLFALLRVGFLCLCCIFFCGHLLFESITREDVTDAS